MSSQGAGTVVFVPGAAILMLGGVVVGTGIIIGKSIMWCHDKAEQNYREACKSYSALRERAEAELLRQPADRSLIIAATIDRNTSALNLIGGSDVVLDSSPQASSELLLVLKQAQEAVTSQAVQPDEYERGKERRRLAIAIAVARGALQDAALDAARRALAGTTQDMLNARRQLNDAWVRVADSNAQQRRHESEVTLIVAEVQRKLETTQAIAQLQNVVLEQQIENKISEAKQRLLNAQQILPHNGAEAERVAESALGLADEVVYGVATEVDRSHDLRRRQTAQVRGQLEAIQALIADVETGSLASAEVRDGLRRRASHIEKQWAAIAGVAAAGTVGDDINTLLDQIEALKTDVFKVVTPIQQQHIGTAIAETLGELGFSPIGDETRLTPTANGDSMTIAARRLESPGDRSSDDHFVYFSVDKQGRVKYHFDGYQGDACVQEADRVFKALRKRGVLISTRAKVSALDPETAASTLALDQLAPDLSVNSQQALRQQALLAVLRRLGHSHIDQRIVGGVVELDAHNGVGHTLTTRIDPEGDFEVEERGNPAPGATPGVIEDELRQVEVGPGDDEDDLEVVRPARQTYHEYGGNAMTQSN